MDFRIFVELYFALSLFAAIEFISSTEYVVKMNWEHRADAGAGYIPLRLPIIDSIHYVFFPSVIIIKIWQFVHHMPTTHNL